MLVNLLSSSNRGSYNIDIAHAFGLNSAIYIDTLINIMEKAVRKKRTYGENNDYVRLDREYITKVTTLSIEEQLEIDKKLIQLGVLQKLETGELNLNLFELSNIIISDEESLMEDVKTIMQRVHKSTKRTKEESNAEKVKHYVKTNNEELRSAYFQWIDSVVEKEGWMSTTAVISGEQVVDTFANHNLDVALAVVNIASINGYRDMTWAVNRFNDSYKLKYFSETPQTNYSERIVTEVF